MWNTIRYFRLFVLEPYAIINYKNIFYVSFINTLIKDYIAILFTLELRNKQL